MFGIAKDVNGQKATYAHRHNGYANVNVYPDEDNLQYVVTLTFKLRTSTSEPQTYTTILKQQG